MHRRVLLVAVGSLATSGCLGGGRTPTPSPTQPDYVGRFETTLAPDDVEVRELVVDGRVASLTYAVTEPTESGGRETIHITAGVYAPTIGGCWPVDRLRVTVRLGGEHVVRYRIETA